MISYTVGEAKILESHDITEGGSIVRTLNIGRSKKDLIVRLANKGTKVSVSGYGIESVTVREAAHFITSRIPASTTPLDLAFVIGGEQKGPVRVIDLNQFTRGGPAQWPEPRHHAESVL